MPSPITETPLFKSVAPRVAQLLTNEELEFELIRAASVTQVLWAKTDVYQAILWDKTPQKARLWSVVNEQYRIKVREERNG